MDTLNYKFPFSFGSFKQEGCVLIELQRMKGLSESESKEFLKKQVQTFESIEEDEEPVPISQEAPLSFYMQ